jgi:hypothetical protein
MRREDLAVIGENALAAVVHGLPRPRSVSEGQCFGDHVPRVIKKVRAKVTGSWVVSNDLEPANILSSDATIRGVDDELPTWPPLVHVAREDPHRGRFRCGRGLALRQPSADEDLEAVECAGPWIRIRYGLLSLQLVMCFRAAQRWRSAPRRMRRVRCSAGLGVTIR